MMSEDCTVKSHVQLLANVRTNCRFLKFFLSSEKHEVKRLDFSQYVCMILVENFFSGLISMNVCIGNQQL